MSRHLPPLVALVSALSLHPALLLHPARAEVEPSVCARPEVLRLLVEEFRQRDLYPEIEPNSVGERSTVQPGRAECALVLRLQAYDTNTNDTAPLFRFEQRFYSVTRLQNGLRVHLAD